ncbi:MAG: molybdopterin cofactor-binding domain-containing protein, partial [Xanthobacteraceae bacterium]
TGGVKLLNYVVVNDCGKAINPQTAEGQIHGGVVHGIGNAFLSRSVDGSNPASENLNKVMPDSNRNPDAANSCKRGFADQLE